LKLEYDKPLSNLAFNCKPAPLHCGNSTSGLVDTSRLAWVLSGGDKPLEAALHAFTDAFAPVDRFRANCALCIMLQVRLVICTAKCIG